MTPAKFAAYIRLRTKTNSTTFPDADILTYANIVKDDMVKEITKVNEDYFGMELLRDLEAGKRSYLYPSDVLNQIKYTQAMLDAINWSHLEEFDVNSYRRPTDEDSILANWAGKKPEFDIFGGQLVIYNDTAIIDVPDGLKLWAMIYPADLTSLAGTTDMSVAPSTISFGVPRQLHKVWATMVIVEYKTSKEKPIPLTEDEQNVQIAMQQAVNSLRGGNLDRAIVATVRDDSNNGQDY